MSAPPIRKARVDDAANIAAIHIASSDDTYAPLAASWRPAEAAIRAAQWTKTLAAGDLVLVAEAADGGLIGFAGGGRARRNEPSAPFEIYVIHVQPQQRGRGVGDALFCKLGEVLRGPQWAAMYVDTLAELRCCSFYEWHGGQRIEHRPVEFHGATRTHVTYRWEHGASHAVRYLPKTT